MTQARVLGILDRLELHYGRLKPVTPAGAYAMVVYANCGYPANDDTCRKGFAALRKKVGIQPRQILAASDNELTEILRLGGIVPQLRARRLKEIASRVQNNFGGNLDRQLRKSLAEAKNVLKQFPTIGDPGAEKILLFTRTAAVAAVPSNCVHVPLRLGIGTAYNTYSKDYRSVQEALAAEVKKDCGARLRAYLLLQQHGHELCKRSRPRCAACPVTEDCRYYQTTR